MVQLLVKSLVCGLWGCVESQDRLVVEVMGCWGEVDERYLFFINDNKINLNIANNIETGVFLSLRLIRRFKYSLIYM